MRCHPRMSNNLILCRKLCHTCLSRCLEPPTRMDRLMLQWLLCLRELMRWTTHWTHGSVRALPHKVGQLTSSRQWCLSRAISNCDHKQGGLFLLLASVASLHQGVMETLNLGCSMLPGVLGRLLHLWASFLVILSARTPAGTADVDRVMSGVEHDDHTCYSCEQRLLNPEGVPGAPWQPPRRRVVNPGAPNVPPNDVQYEVHELHVCMGCERAMTFSTPVGGGDPWAAPEWCLPMALCSMRSGQLATAYWDVDFWYWSDDEYYGHYLLEKRNWSALGCLTLVLLYFVGMGPFVFALCLFLFWWCLVVLCCLFGVLVLFLFAVLRIVSPPLSSHRSCGVLHVSQWKGTGLALRLMSSCA